MAMARSAFSKRRFFFFSFRRLRDEVLDDPDEELELDLDLLRLDALRELPRRREERCECRR